MLPQAYCAPAAPKCNFNRLSLKKSRKVLPLQEAKQAGRVEKQQRFVLAECSPRHGTVNFLPEE